MIKPGDLVKVIGTTVNEELEMAELIPIGTICEVIDVDEKGIAEIVPYKSGDRCGYRYNEEDLERGGLVWIPQNENIIAQIRWQTEDIESALEERGISVNEKNVNMVLNKLGVGTGNNSLENCEPGWEIINYAINSCNFLQEQEEVD